jgi:hypothetical protein
MHVDGFDTVMLANAHERLEIRGFTTPLLGWRGFSLGSQQHLQGR